MRSLLQDCPTTCTPEGLAEELRDCPGLVLLRTMLFDSPQARYSMVAARPFLTFRSFGSRCELRAGGQRHVQFGDPWRLLERLLGRFELLEEVDLPFPLGACVGYWGYDLKSFLEPKLPRRALNDLELPDCHLGFYGNFVVFDHRAGKTWLIATGLDAEGRRQEDTARRDLEFWHGRICSAAETSAAAGTGARPACGKALRSRIVSNLSREGFISRVERAQSYIRSGDIYQVNLSHRLEVTFDQLQFRRRDAAETRPRAGLHHFGGWELFERLGAASPAPFAAYIHCGEFELASSSPELFLRLSGSHIQTRPIKGTRPRSADPVRDAQLAYELQTSAKEAAELVMITDLLRNDLGKVCQFGTVQATELLGLERYAQVQHLVSTLEGRLRPEVTHLAALSACFPGGSITGAPKFRAMAIIDELEPIARGPYTGALGYLGFNRESQLSIIIRDAICCASATYFHVGAGIVADSIPAAEYEETLAKAGGLFEALRLPPKPVIRHFGGHLNRTP